MVTYLGVTGPADSGITPRGVKTVETLYYVYEMDGGQWELLASSEQEAIEHVSNDILKNRLAGNWYFKISPRLLITSDDNQWFDALPVYEVHSDKAD